MVFSRQAHAECTKDIECKGDRVCVDGICVDPPTRAPDPGLSAPPPEASTIVPAPTTPDEAPRTERRSKALFVSGIVSLALVPVALAVSSYGWFEKESCQMDNEHDANVAAMRGGSSTASRPADCSRFDGTMYGGAAVSVALLGGGLAMLLVGVQKVPVEKQSTTSIRPWFSTTSGGLGLQTTF